jgi:hypothetical protein
MKKLLFIIIAALCLIQSANAQIQKTGSIKTTTIASCRMGFVNLSLSEGLFFLSIGTTNQFDNMMLLKLGDNKESAIQSLNDLVDILDSLTGDDLQRIDNGFGKEFRLYKLLGALYINADGYAGSGNIGKSELNKFIKALKAHK